MVDLLKLFICSTLKPLARFKNLGDISYIWSYGPFYPKFRFHCNEGQSE